MRTCHRIASLFAFQSFVHRAMNPLTSLLPPHGVQQMRQGELG